MRTYSRKRPEPQVIEDVQDLCRLCLTKCKDAVPIFTDNSGNVCAALALRIMICVGLEMSQNECLPNMVCSTCHEELERYYAFRKKCEVSYQKLKTHFLAVQMKQYRKDAEQEPALLKEDKSILKKNTKLMEVEQFSTVVDQKQNKFKIKQLQLLGSSHIIFTMDSEGCLQLCNQDDEEHTLINVTTENREIFKPNTFAENSELIIDDTSVIQSHETVVGNDDTVGENNHTIGENNQTVDNNHMVNPNIEICVENNEVAVINNKIDDKDNGIVTENIEIYDQSKHMVDNKNQVVICKGSKSATRNENRIIFVTNECPQNDNVQIETEPTEQDLSKFLTTMLMDVGVVTRRDDGSFEVDDYNTTIEVVTEDGNEITLELMEEEVLENSTVEQTSLEQAVENNGISPDAIIKFGKVKSLTDGQAKKAKSTEGTVTPDKPWRGADCKGKKCLECGKTFASRSVAERHARAVHARERPHACRVCQRRFAQKEVCTRHELVHNEVRPFSCSSCPKSFTQRGALASHVRSHAPPHARPLQLHRCDKCPKVFLYSSGLTRHMVIHTGRVFACGGCKHQFRDKSSLKRHLRNTKHALHHALHDNNRS